MCLALFNYLIMYTLTCSLETGIIGGLITLAISYMLSYEFPLFIRYLPFLVLPN